MIAVIQRVMEASITIDKEITASIANGLLVLLGIEEADNSDDIEWLSRKVTNMRLFEDENQVMNKSMIDVNAELLIVSQFTLHASTKKGNRPSYIKAAKPDFAIPLYENFIDTCKSLLSTKVATGTFGADMKVQLVNDGPVTIIIDTKDRK